MKINKNFTLWVKCALIRAAKTFAQTAIASVGTEAVFTEIKWGMVLGTAAVAAILSMLTSVLGLPECKKGE